MNINVKRRSEINKIRSQIRNMNAYIQNDTDTIERFRKLNTKDDYYTSQIEYKRLKNTDRENEIIILKKRILDVEKGVFDRDLAEAEKVILDEITIKKEEIQEPIILFETQKDNLVIHETTNSEYKIWHKKGNSKKYLYSNTPRRQLSIASSSFENYIK